MGVFPTDLRETHSIGSQTREWLVPDTACPALHEARIQLCGVSAARPGFGFVRRCPERSQLLLSLGPGGSAWLDGAWHDLATGQGYLTPPGASHAYHCQPGAEWLTVWVILLEPEDEPRLVTAEAPTLLNTDARPLHDAVLNLHRETVGAGDPAIVRLYGELVGALVRRHLAPVRTDQRLWRLWEEVDADLGRPWTLGDLARLAGLGDEQLRRLCQRHLGVSPMQHLTRLRMHRAAALLATGGRSVGTVATVVGYDNAFAFSTAFRRLMGRPPSQLLPA
jgi:AraC-like DNA-binding protein